MLQLECSLEPNQVGHILLKFNLEASCIHWTTYFAGHVGVWSLFSGDVFEHRVATGASFDKRILGLAIKGDILIASDFRFIRAFKISTCLLAGTFVLLFYANVCFS
jgi:hypothetical protein